MKKTALLIVINLILMGNAIPQCNDFKNAIQYRSFSPRVDSLVLKAIEIDQNFNNPDTLNTGYFLLYNNQNDTTSISLLKYSKNDAVFDSIGNINDLINYIVLNSNRYVLLQNQCLPIIFRSDYRMGILKRLEGGGIIEGIYMDGIGDYLLFMKFKEQGYSKIYTIKAHKHYLKDIEFDFNRSIR